MVNELCIIGLAALCLSQKINTSDSVAYDMGLEQVVVTGTRSQRILKDVPVQTRVISSNDISRTDASDIQDILQQELPGVEFSYTMSQHVSMNLSGFAGQSVLILVDGERLAGDTQDNIDFSRLDMNDVERIEIVKGAASALYGSSAAGGVINIITKQQKNRFSASANARLSEHNGQRYNATLGFRQGKFDNQLNGYYSHIDNYDVQSAPNAATRTFNTVFGHNTLNIKNKLSFHPNERICITGRAGYFFRSVPRVADTPERYRDFNGGLRATWQITKVDQLEASYSFDQYDKSDYQRITGLDIRDYSNVQNSFRTCYNHSFSPSHQLIVGGDYMHDYLMNINLDGRTREQDVVDLFAQHDWCIDDNWEVVCALRYDYHSDGKQSNLTPRIAARYRLNNLSLRASYGMGFRAPALKEKYYNFDILGIWILTGNEELKAERSHNISLSGEYTWRNWNFSLSGYFNQVRNRITTGLPFTKGDNPQLYMSYRNIPRLSIFNLEATIQAHWRNGLNAKAGYVYSNEHNPEAAVNQYMPPRRHSVNAQISWQHYWTRSTKYLFSASVFGRYLSSVSNTEYIDMYDIAKGTTKVDYPGYALVKLIVSQQLSSHLQLTLTVDNLLNYTPKYYYYNAPLTTGINAMAGIKVSLP